MARTRDVEDAVEGRRTSGLSLDEAVAEAIRECKRRGIMSAYLESRGSEVLGMLLTEWNMEDALRVAHEEEREMGLAEGERRGRELGERRAALAHAARMKSADIDVRLIVECTGLAPDEVAGL
jgi:predicted transposase YdaD